MPVGVHDQVERPAQPAELAQDRLGVRGVDAGDLAGGLIADQESVIVAETGELMDLERHKRSSGGFTPRPDAPPDAGGWRMTYMIG